MTTHHHILNSARLALALALCCTLMLSCAKKEADNTDKESSPADSTVAVATDSVAAPEPEENPYVSPALQALCLKGPVKRVVYMEDGHTILAIAFGKKGVPFSMRNYNDEYAINIETDEQGRLKYALFNQEWNDEVEFTYNDQGYIKTFYSGSNDGGYTNVYSAYDADGNPTRMSSSGVSEADGSYKSGNKLEHMVIDDHGNWTQEVSSGASGEIGIDEDQQTVSKYKSVMKRKIEYY